MAKKLPKGYSVKSKREEIGLQDMYRWQIWKDGKKLKEAYGLEPSAQEARAEGVKKLWEEIEEGNI